MNQLNMKTLENLGFCIFDDEAKGFAEKFAEDLQAFCKNYMSKAAEQSKEKEKFSPYENFANLANEQLEIIKTDITNFDKPLTKLYDKNYKDKTAVVKEICDMMDSLYEFIDDCIEELVDFKFDNNL